MVVIEDLQTKTGRFLLRRWSSGPLKKIPHLKSDEALWVTVTIGGRETGYQIVTQGDLREVKEACLNPTWHIGPLDHKLIYDMEFMPMVR